MKHCPTCGHELRSKIGKTCPSCGLVFNEKVKSKWGDSGSSAGGETDDDTFAKLMAEISLEIDGPDSPKSSVKAPPAADPQDADASDDPPKPRRKKNDPSSETPPEVTASILQDNLVPDDVLLPSDLLDTEKTDNDVTPDAQPEAVPDIAAEEQPEGVEPITDLTNGDLIQQAPPPLKVSNADLPETAGTLPAVDESGQTDDPPETAIGEPFGDQPGKNKSDTGGKATALSGASAAISPPGRHRRFMRSILIAAAIIIPVLIVAGIWGNRRLNGPGQQQPESPSSYRVPKITITYPETISKTDKVKASSGSDTSDAPGPQPVVQTVGSTEKTAVMQTADTSQATAETDQQPAASPQSPPETVTETRSQTPALTDGPVETASIEFPFDKTARAPAGKGKIVMTPPAIKENLMPEGKMPLVSETGSPPSQESSPRKMRDIPAADQEPAQPEEKATDAPAAAARLMPGEEKPLVSEAGTPPPQEGFPGKAADTAAADQQAALPAETTADIPAPTQTAIPMEKEPEPPARESLSKLPSVSDGFSYPYEDLEKEKAFFTIQVYSWKDKAKAFYTLDILRLKDYPAYIVEKKNQNGDLIYKLRIGQYLSRSEAQQAAQSYKNSENKDYLILFTHTPPIEQPILEGEAEPVMAAPPDERPDAPEEPSPAPSPGPVNHWYTTLETENRYFTIQVYSWRDKANAKQGLDELRNKGYAAYVIQRKTSTGEELCKLRFGKFDTRADAEKAAAAFIEKEKLDAIVIASNIRISI